METEYKPTTAEVAYIPSTSIMLDTNQFQSITKLIEALEDLDDVQNVYTNFDIEENILDTAINE